MDANSLILSLCVGLFGFFCSQFLQRQREMKAHKQVGDAVRSLRAKGYKVSLDRLSGLDTDTQTEMERVRAVGYTVLDKDGKPIAIGTK